MTKDRSFTNKSLKHAVKLWLSNKNKAIERYGHITFWNTERVTDMSYMFDDASSFDEKLNWNTEKVTNMRYMFCDAKRFNKHVNFNTSNVIDMSYMFYGASSFDKPTNFNTNNVINMSYMFYGALSFNQLIKFNTSNVMYMNNMFHGAKRFDQPINFNTDNVIDMRYMFTNATNFRIIPVLNIHNDPWRYIDMIKNTELHKIFGITTLYNISPEHPCYNWSRRKNYMIMLTGSGFINGNGSHRLFEIEDMYRYIVKFI